MSQSLQIALGLDFGTESVRAILVDLAGNERGVAVARYPHGQITKQLPTSSETLPHDFAFQHPSDWLEASALAVREVLSRSGVKGEEILSIGVDFTSCTMLPALRDGTPLCLVPEFSQRMFAWPKLWKHHGAKSQTDRINALARERKEPWLARYGGIIGLEWFFPKVFETLEADPEVYEAAEVWLEAGDWYVWQLVGGDAQNLPRSTCQAGYKAMWSAADGYPSPEFFGALDARLKNVVREKMPGKMHAPGSLAGTLCPTMAQRFGLPAGVPVSAAIIDAHAGVPGAGADEDGVLVLVMGTSSCHMLNAREEHLVPGVAGVVADGILPGYFGYETGQAAVGDAFDWVRQLVGGLDFKTLDERAQKLPPGAEGVLCMDWFNGCRTPLMDGALRGAFTGLSLAHGPQHLYRAVLEASAFGVRWIVDLLRDHQVPVKRLVATGGLPHHNPLLVQIYADVLRLPIEIHPSAHGPALGAAILGVLAAGKERSGFTSAAEAIRVMSHPQGEKAKQVRVVLPHRDTAQEYDALYRRYRRLAQSLRAEAVV